MVLCYFRKWNVLVYICSHVVDDCPSEVIGGYRPGLRLGDLVMNSFEELRQVNEIRLREYYQQRYTEPDPQRGCPGFWKMPHYLKPFPGQRWPTHFAVMTPLDKCELPSVDYVRVPRDVQITKEVLPRSRFTIARDLLDRQRPELDNLIVSSVPIWHDIFKEKKVKEITVTEPVKPQPESPKVEPQPTPERFHLKINGLEIYPGSNTMGTRKIYLLFDYDLSKKEIMTQYLHLENLGSVVVRYYWIPNPKYEMFADIIPDKPVKSLFFFNKNEQILMPETTYDFPVWFKTQDEGIHVEQWQLRFKPATVSDSLKLVIVMHASAYHGDEKEKKERIEIHLANNVRSRLIEECLEYVFPKRRRKLSRPQVYTYNKKEIFEAINTEFSPCDKRVKYLYNKEVVEELEDLYYILRRPSDPLYWNLSLIKLKKLARYQDIRLEALERRKIFTAYDESVEAMKKLQEEKAEKFLEQLEASRRKILQKYTTKEEFEELYPPDESVEEAIEERPHVVLVENPPEGEEKEIEEAVPSPLKILEESTETNKYTKYFNWLVEKLETQTSITNEDLVTYQRVYAILCTYFDIIEQKAEQLKSIVHVDHKKRFVTYSSSKENYLQQATGLSLVQSFFKMPQWYVEKTINMPREPPPPSYKTDKPPPESLKDIPLEECKKRYKTYYNLPMTPPPGGKGKKGGKGDKKKGKSDKGSSKTDKGSKKGAAAKAPKEVDDGYKVDENFDPFAEQLPTEISFKEEEKSSESMDESSLKKILTSRSSIIRRNMVTAYEHNLYVIFYVYICRAIDEIVDVLSVFERNAFALPDVKEIYQSRHSVHTKLINVKRLVTSSKRMKPAKVQVPEKKHWFTKEMEEDIARIQSKSSLWSLIYPQEQLQQPAPTKEPKKPISYPETVKAVGSWQSPTEIKSTSTVEGGILDPNFEYFKDKEVQKYYRRADQKDDLEEYIEKLQFLSSAQNLGYDLSECALEDSGITAGTATEIFLTSSTSTTDEGTATTDARDKKGTEMGSLKPDVCTEGDEKCTNPDCQCKS